MGTSLRVQWLWLHTPNGGDLGSTPGQGTRSHVTTKRPRATTKTQCSQINEEINEKAGNIPEIATPEEVSRCKKIPKQENPGYISIFHTKSRSLQVASPSLIIKWQKPSLWLGVK